MATTPKRNQVVTTKPNAAKKQMNINQYNSPWDVSAVRTILGAIIGSPAANAYLASVAKQTPQPTAKTTVQTNNTQEVPLSPSGSVSENLKRAVEKAFAQNISLGSVASSQPTTQTSIQTAQTPSQPSAPKENTAQKEKLDTYSLRLQQAAMYGNTPEEKTNKVNQQIALWLSRGIITPEEADYLRQDAAIWLPAPQQNTGLFGNNMDALMQFLLLLSLLKQ
jgi:hypothetical protein